MISGNKGEWSELYVLLKLLGDGELYSGDAELNKITSECYIVKNVIRKDKIHKEKLEYKCTPPTINIFSGSTLIKKIDQEKFKIKATELLNDINKTEGVFPLPCIESFMRDIFCSTLKAPSKDKSDINIVLHDLHTLSDKEFGFSIKSRLGGKSTLLNSSSATNVIYEIIGDISKNDLEIINLNDSKSKIRNKIKDLDSKQSHLKFIKMCDVRFQDNLTVIDSQLPLIIASLLLEYYKDGIAKISQTVENIQNSNPCGFDLSYKHPYYEYKVKNFLSDIALGFTPTSIWNGNFDSTGGYIIVKEDGDVVCYHVYNRNEFRDYLFKNTFFDTPSQTRYKFGNIYFENGKSYIKLNIQIRFY